MDQKLSEFFNKLSINPKYNNYSYHSCYNCSDVENIWKPIKKIFNKVQISSNNDIRKVEF
jgi:hypothetical protein